MTRRYSHCYRAGRANAHGANETLEKPVFDELMGDVIGLRIRLMLFRAARRPRTEGFQATNFTN